MQLESKVVFSFSAPSGAGKTTIVHSLVSRYNCFAFSISATTRAPRAHERHGKDYYFLTPEAFRSHIEARDFLEWEEVYKDTYYGTLASEVDRIRAMGKYPLFDVDVQGGLHLKRHFGDRGVAFFIAPPNLDVLESRLRLRATNTEADITRRINKAASEITYADRFDHCIVNDDLTRALRELDEIMGDYGLYPITAP